jgi:hypothetical protein
MTTVTLSIFAGVGAQLFDNNGVPLSGGKIYSYVAGTTTPQATYTSASGVTAHSNPIVLDSGGRVPGGEIWLTDGLQYKFVLKTSADVSIATYDNVPSIGSDTMVVNDFTGDGASVSFTLVTPPNTENNIQVYINGVYQNKSSFTLSGATLTFSEAPPLTSLIEVTYF